MLAAAVGAACTPGTRDVAHRAPSPAAAVSSPAAPATADRSHHPHPVRPAVPVLHPPSDHRQLTLVRTITGPISPKSVAAGPDGVVTAQNMMYRHTVTVYRPDGRLLATVPDSVELSAYGIAGHPGRSSGAPVEAAFAPDGRHVYVSNYSMYGAGFGPEGSDVCSPTSAARAGVSPSFVYRISTRSWRIDRVYPVGLVPKFLTVSPDGRLLLVSNWCSYTVTVIDLRTGRPAGSVYVGAYPRGIAVTADSHRAYVAVMGASTLAVLDLQRLKVSRRIYVGNGPRHVVLDPRRRFVYVTLNGEGSVVKVDRRSGRVVDRVVTGRDPRTMAIAPDGRTLYVVNYFSDTVTVVRAADLAPLQTIATGDDPVPSHPIGITYDRHGNRVWVALYSGKILVFAAR